MNRASARGSLREEKATKLRVFFGMPFLESAGPPPPVPFLSGVYVNEHNHQPAMDLELWKERACRPSLSSKFLGSVSL